MATCENAETNVHSVLAASGRAAEILESDDLYGPLVGSWSLDVRRYLVDVSGQHIKGEVHFGWVLEGLAIQDVWIMHERSKRAGVLSKALNMYGTTLRVWDHAIGAWRVTWLNPLTGTREELIGRRSGADIVQ